ncbi:hypothetical protein EDB92DRAFT_491428 [Lactarius akahatsu]|uniref:Uncharacterized protein n=1 Tax=Lactarius akahatsu TaxID=416441 RepID=A0AAD4LQZ0_9AGAM|nr:hypothetical protein EDB92DRAFT_491428 [Lactarius akahatsu]
MTSLVTSPDIYVDGYIAYTFTSQVAEIYLAHLFKAGPKRVQAFGIHNWPGVFFVADPPMNHCRLRQIGNGRYAWLLDYVIRPGGSVVPQQLWSPQGQECWDQERWCRTVEQSEAQLHVPVFFVNADGSLGVQASQAAVGNMSLRDSNEPAPLGNGLYVNIRIRWPGRALFEQQTLLRNQTPTRNAITLSQFVMQVGRKVLKFFEVGLSILWPWQ